MRLRSILLLLWALPLLGRGQAPAESAQPPAHTVTVTTPSLPATPTNALSDTIATRHFRVMGLGAAENAPWAAFAESVYERIDRSLAWPDTTADRQPSIRIELQRDPQSPEGRIIKSQRQFNGILDQRLRVINPYRLDREDFLEALCWLVCNRRWLPESSVLNATPEWLSVGLAQNLYGELQRRNRQVVLRRWQEGRRTPWADVLGWRLLRDGRWAEKAVCGVAVEWLRSWPERDALLSTLARMPSNDPPTMLEWLARHGPETGSARELEQRWDLWVLHLEEVMQDLGELTRRQTDALRALLNLAPAEFMITGMNIPERITAAELIAQREQPWAQALAQRLPTQLAVLGVGRPAEFQSVLSAYTAFFKTLAAQPPAGRLARLFYTRPSRAKLVRLLIAADRQLADLEKTLDQRQDYMSQVEARLALRPALPAAPAATNPPAEH